MILKEFLNPNSTAIDHNQYVVGDKVYQSNYVQGLRILDISDIENPKEVGFFDTVPFGDNGTRFDGSWSNYPFFKSGTIVVNSGKEGCSSQVLRRETDRSRNHKRSGRNDHDQTRARSAGLLALAAPAAARSMRSDDPAPAMAGFGTRWRSRATRSWWPSPTTSAHRGPSTCTASGDGLDRGRSADRRERGAR